jgi:hypothetical protein
MKTCKSNPLGRIAVVSLIALGAALTTQAQTIISWSEDVWGFSGTTGGAGGPVNVQAGVVLAGNWNDTWQANFNNVNSSGVTMTGLYDNAGAATTASVTYAAFNGAAHIWGPVGLDADGSNNKQMLNGYLNAGPSAWGPPIDHSYTAFNGIPFAQYDIYVYFGSDAAVGRPGIVTDGTTTYSFTTVPDVISGANAALTRTTDTIGANPAATYAVFTGLTGGSQTITCRTTGGNDQWLGISAIQIVAVPEPGVLALLIAGLGGLALKRRQK